MTELESGALGVEGARTRRATKDDLQTLASIHKKAYSRSHFTALLPDVVLMRYYGYFLEGGSEIQLARCDADSGDSLQGAVEGVQGFAVFGKGIPGRIAQFKRECFVDILLASLRHPWSAARKTLQKALSRMNSQAGYPPAEFLLLSIAVAVPKRGVGRRLLGIMLNEAQRQGVKTVGLYVNTDNVTAINTYFSAGFVVMNSHGGQFYMERILDSV